MSDAQVKAEVMDVLRKMYPAKPIPEPKGFYFYRWHSDPLYRGSYSDWPPRCVPFTRALANVSPHEAACLGFIATTLSTSIT